MMGVHIIDEINMPWRQGTRGDGDWSSGIRVEVFGARDSCLAGIGGSCIGSMPATAVNTWTLDSPALHCDEMDLNSSEALGIVYIDYKHATL